MYEDEWNQVRRRYQTPADEPKSHQLWKEPRPELKPSWAKGMAISGEGLMPRTRELTPGEREQEKRENERHRLDREEDFRGYRHAVNTDREAWRKESQDRQKAGLPPTEYDHYMGTVERHYKPESLFQSLGKAQDAYAKDFKARDKDMNRAIESEGNPETKERLEFLQSYRQTECQLIQRQNNFDIARYGHKAQELPRCERELNETRENYQTMRDDWQMRAEMAEKDKPYPPLPTEITRPERFEQQQERGHAWRQDPDLERSR